MLSPMTFWILGHLMECCFLAYGNHQQLKFLNPCISQFCPMHATLNQAGSCFHPMFWVELFPRGSFYLIIFLLDLLKPNCYSRHGIISELFISQHTEFFFSFQFQMSTSLQSLWDVSFHVWLVLIMLFVLFTVPKQEEKEEVAQGD